MDIPLIPRPPLCCVLKLSTVIRLIYPRLVIAIIVLPRGIKSSMLISASSYPNAERLSSPYLSEITIISVRITPRRSFSSAKIALYSSIFFKSSICSCSSFSRSKPVNARRRISTIACACTSVRPKRATKPSFAACVFALPRMILITSSILSSAISKPCKIWSRSSALFKSYCVLRVTTSS